MGLTHKLRRTTLWAFAGIGLLSTGLALRGLAIDLSNFDRTQGGYEPPYIGWTGTPTDWAAVDTSPTGMARRGVVTNLLIDCTSGMISMQVYGVTIPFRPFSPRALAVHKPREACIDKGFTPEF